MTEEKNLRVLFVGLANSRVAWYRCFLPGFYLGADWVGLAGQPPRFQFVTGYVEGATKSPDFTAYDVIVLQQPRGKAWLRFIHNLRAQGTIVLYEIDDFVHGIRTARDHDFAQYFQKKDLKEMELCMRACDGMIVSTDYLARRYQSYTPRTWTCLNGLDMGRYRLTRPKRGVIDGHESVTIMWSGATGHLRGVEPWIQVVKRVMDKYPHVCFASIGQDFASQLGEFGQRVISVPFAALETYPAAMMLGDIALAPAGDTSWYRGKSDLRVMEAAALGIPVIADHHYHESVIDGHTGYVINHPGEALGRLELLIEDRELRHTMGDAARTHAQANFDMARRRQGWKSALLEAFDGKGEYVHAA